MTSQLHTDLVASLQLQCWSIREFRSTVPDACRGWLERHGLELDEADDVLDIMDRILAALATAEAERAIAIEAFASEALARAASGGNATRTGDPRPDGSREP